MSHRSWRDWGSAFVALGIALACMVATSGAAAAPRQMENLGRGLVASNKGGGNVYLSWRVLGLDPGDIGFNVYRSTSGGAASKLNAAPITATSCYNDSGVDISRTNVYSVRPVIGGQEQPASSPFTLQPNTPSGFWLTLPLDVPAGGTTPDGIDYDYSANDCSVGDLDGDGEYEIVVKWDPSNSKDNASGGFTGNVLLDSYKLDGTRLWRINLGINIRAGAHYTQFMVYDLDGDGKAEVACKTAPGTTDGSGAPVIMDDDDPGADYRNTSGYILSGPEYLTIFEGATGRNLWTTNYIPARGNVADWGDSYGNRVDRFLACVAYLDGARPSLVMCRGYYTRSVLAAWDWRNAQLTQRWVFDSNNPGYSGYRGQGNHNLSVGDVDGDGFDEIVYGACAIDHNGTGLYTTGLGHGDAMHLSDMDPDRAGLEVWDIHETGSSAGGGEFRDAGTGALIWGISASGDTGRGCAAHIDAAHRGYQMWSSASGGTFTKDGTLISTAVPKYNFLAWWDPDVQRETVDVADGDGVNPIINKWNGGGEGRALSLYNYPSPYVISANNSTKANPCLSGDILGDWREELVYRLRDSSALLIFFANTPSTNRFYTFMHDPQYRLALAWQNVAYNQPPHPGFYVGAGMASPPVPNIFYPASTPIPLPPFALAATAASSNRVFLSWFPTATATSYNIRRALASGGPYSTLTTGVVGTTYTDNSVSPGTTYYYVVSASTPQGESGDSNESAAFMSDLVVHLKFDETTGTTAHDSSGNGRDATELNGPMYGTGMLKRAVTLESGFSQYLRLPAGVVSGLNDFTLCAWVNVSSFNNWARVFDFGAGTTDYMFLTMQYDAATANAGKMRFAIRTPTVTEQVISSSVAVAANSWVHVAVTLSGTTARLYLNGTQVGFNSSMTLKPSSLGNTTRNYLGKSQFFDPYFDGGLDDLRIYNRALTVSELATLANPLAEAPGNLTATPGDGAAILTWDVANGATTYNLKRSNVRGGPYATVASGLIEPTFTDVGLTEGTTYYYVVSGSNVRGESADSPEVSVTPNYLRIHLKFDETSGDIAADASGRGFNATTVNGPAWEPGKHENALRLSASSAQYVELPVRFASGLSNFTLAAWVKLSNPAANSRIFDCGVSTSPGATTGGYMFLAPTGANGVRFALTTNGYNNEQQISGPAPFASGVWTHVAVTLSGSMGRLYVNGAVVGANSGFTLDPTTLGGITRAYAGKSLFSVDPYLNGSIDDFRVYGRALSAGEIATLAAPLAAPANLTASAGDGQVTLTWSPSVAATSYQILRSLTDGGPYSQIASATSTTFADTGLTNGTRYYYVAKASNAVAVSAPSAQVSAQPVSITPPALGVQASETQLQLSWPASHRGWRLQSQTNAPGRGLGTDWIDFPGANLTNFIMVPAAKSNGSVFFRLAYP